MNKPIRYEVYVEGSLHDTFNTLKQANNKVKEFESEGWNVKLVAIYNTIIGEAGVEL